MAQTTAIAIAKLFARKLPKPWPPHSGVSTVRLAVVALLHGSRGRACVARAARCGLASSIDSAAPRVCVGVVATSVSFAVRAASPAACALALRSALATELRACSSLLYFASFAACKVRCCQCSACVRCVFACGGPSRAGEPS